MSAVYKVMEQMQKTQPRARNNGVMLLGFGFVLSMLLFLIAISGAWGGPPAPDPRQLPWLRMPTADNARIRGYHGAVITISLNEAGQWVADGHGVVTEQELHILLMRLRADVNPRRYSRYATTLRARIDADSSAKYLIQLYQLAKDCGFTRFSLAAWDIDEEGS